MMQQFYEVVQKAELLSKGYIRQESKVDIPETVKNICADYFGNFFPDPNDDPSNFVTQDDIQKSLKLKDEGNKLVKEQKYNEAVKKYIIALSYNPNDAKTHGNRSLCYLKLNKLNLSLFHSSKCLELEPIWFKSWLRLAQVFEALQQYLECLNMIEHALKICAANDDKRNSKMLQKYYKTIFERQKEYLKSHPNKFNINHANDEDREEWRYCKPGLMDEGKVCDEQLLNASPYLID
eukprot:214745_1